MSTITEAAAATSPPERAWIPLRDGWLACCACGIAVEPPFTDDSIEVFTIFAGRYEAEVQMSRCEVCTAIRDAAVDLMRAHPEQRARIGSPEIAAYRLELALSALDAIGINDPARIDRLTDTGGDIRRLIEFLAVPGGWAQWSAKFSPRPEPGLSASSAAAARWSGVSAEARRDLKAAYLALFAARTEKPVKALCPSEDGQPSGCMLCGVGAVMALRSRADYQWVEMSADAVTIGGRDAPDSLDGCVCPTCDRAIDSAGGVGQSAMRLSVLALLGIPGHLQAVSQIDGIVGWGVLRGAVPNETPWAHVDLNELRAEVERLGY